MSNSKELSKHDVQTRQHRELPQRSIRPDVDIFEDERGITLKADLPGVNKEGLDIQVDKETLSIDGKAEIEMPEAMQALYADVRATRYQRSFSLSSELDGDKTEASLKDGVLSLRIPKREQYQPRKIEIRNS
ncbi:MAG: heat-shock protein [gamma proteobacterium symbiont of Ctena orbiculata]|uniref:Hsp20/alpha crystallin family protein n=1 Tax=Candidatus Thiodiazotropha taylori TaxID=2792791 RepID=A0A944MEX7_9GAMM|nr:Hsp20/alpha crystallin family protein [Candidatus Thiodiazotropha taylori]PUB81572.1 MAG: heat-shock protein [gamma proteobacterium symbiont of Ctena orbiculata]MBT2990608.1 Hsp20/alpha crystallin family protein [Candidatus Thiodiazotropha taylori]MBT2998096.1 Hsp20/alpha crystallin family protein [Candidatus Thiodiazotropha taylori]MBT3002395.1 Hsp20/alpha crystallin family protein [Candidatus Thiodiazotropha taylori]